MLLVFSASTQGALGVELLKIKVSDIDWMMRCVWVGGKAHLKTKGKGLPSHSDHDRAEDLLRNRCEGSHPQATLFGRDWTNKDQLYGAFKKVRKQAGFNEDYVWHSLRHSFATWLGEVTHPRQIMELMGHKHIETTLSIASHPMTLCVKLRTSSSTMHQGRLELPQPKQHGTRTCASTNSATSVTGETIQHGRWG